VSQRHLSALSEAWHAQLTFRNPPPPSSQRSQGGCLPEVPRLDMRSDDSSVRLAALCLEAVPPCLTLNHRRDRDCTTRWIALLAQSTQAFGPVYHPRLLSRVREHLIVSIPTASGAFGPTGDAPALAELESLCDLVVFCASFPTDRRADWSPSVLSSRRFVTLPWAWLKDTVESARFPASERQRFSFAKVRPLVATGMSHALGLISHHASCRRPSSPSSSAGRPCRRLRRPGPRRLSSSHSAARVATSA
jgi:hypothetical protein